MKIYMALDTETTGFKPGQICQLSYVIFNQNSVLKMFNKYYQVESVDEGASKIHGLTVEKLEEISDGQGFADYGVGEILEDLASVDKILIHNAPFDVRFMSAEFERLGLAFNFDSKTFCTMGHHIDICKLPGKGRGGELYKWPKLSETLDYYGVSDEFVLEETKRLFKCESAGYHDARFDVAGVYIIGQKINKLF